MHNKLMSCAAGLALLSTSPAWAATLPARPIPDAGRILQELPVPQQELPQSIRLDVEAPQPAQEKVGGAKVQLNAVHFTDNTHIDEASLQRVVAPAIGKAHDLDELREVARQVTLYYREHGYPFARAYLPAQRMAKGELTIAVIEGRYGKVTAVNDDAKLAAQAQPFLDDLKPGEVIERDRLERSILVLSDLPGVAVRPVIRPGDELGTGDLNAQVSKTKAFEGKATLDNHGNRYSGRNRLTVQGDWNSPMMLGDKLSAAVMATDEELYFGSLGYSMPLGTSGLRGNVGYAQSAYDLGEEFADLGATGTAEVSSIGLSYPLIRSNQANLMLAGQYQHKELEDKYEVLGLSFEKSSNSLPISLQFDVRDTLLGGGITYGGATLTYGDLKLDSALREGDRQTAQTEGQFSKVNVDLARLQALPANFTLFARFLGQWSQDNLDSSEDFSLGGIDGVRAYPQSEASGDEGMLTQIELRYPIDKLTPYLFWDAGKVRINHNEWADEENTRSLSGGGVGLRAQYGQVSFDATVAWRHSGGEAQSDTRQENPQLLAQIGYQF
ncbi:ShlB/FhaC/HecB family hemolysin secretion/activation protein [Pseudomonas frederiksbergensis]|uniref:ShlB/FhaC/HecB family hemolysin secretion/activation protein n=1 Tax=Pseudomonas frederiksbergensis TaxID=104087 RepID=UPI002DBD72E7|nr:ShlB/FhaC/HecB family hemolysin secretion/activation protein [Pseudomonas frederiksbergensis]WRV67478.1 ShlB/FhaC/HecB family hemolysin secretion/activation protein [Pseudomonas frederiksbergensis]